MGMEEARGRGESPAGDLCYSTGTAAPVGFRAAGETLEFVLGVNEMLQRADGYDVVLQQLVPVGEFVT